MERTSPTTSPTLQGPLTYCRCDFIMYHVMKTFTVRDLRYHFSEIEARLQKGEEVQIRKRRRLIARLLPVRPKPEAYPDFRMIRKEIFGDKVSKVAGAESVALERDRY